MVQSLSLCLKISVCYFVQHITSNQSAFQRHTIEIHVILHEKKFVENQYLM